MFPLEIFLGVIIPEEIVEIILNELKLIDIINLHLIFGGYIDDYIFKRKTLRIEDNRLINGLNRCIFTDSIIEQKEFNLGRLVIDQYKNIIIDGNIFLEHKCKNDMISWTIFPDINDINDIIMKLILGTNEYITEIYIPMNKCYPKRSKDEIILIDSIKNLIRGRNILTINGKKYNPSHIYMGGIIYSNRSEILVSSNSNVPDIFL